MLRATTLKLPTHVIAAGLVKHAVSLSQTANGCFVAREIEVVNDG